MKTVAAHMQKTEWSKDNTQRMGKVHALQVCLDLLAPFAYATRIVERDDATLWDAIIVMQSLSAHFGDCANISPEDRSTVLAAIKHRSSMLFRSPAYVLLSWFSPNAFAPSTA